MSPFIESGAFGRSIGGESHCRRIPFRVHLAGQGSPDSSAGAVRAGHKTRRFSSASEGARQHLLEAIPGSGRSRCVSEHRETEVELINRAQSALSNCSWTVGECAAQWTKRYAKGRTDSDFGTLIGLS